MRVCYLILQICPPLVSMLDGIDSKTTERETSSRLNIQLRRKKFYANSEEYTENRYVFGFPNYEQDDLRANQIAEALIYSVNLFHGPFGDKEEYAYVFQIPESIFKKEKIPLMDLNELEDSREPQQKTVRYPKWTLGSTTRVSAYEMIASWKTVSLLLENEYLLNACRFMKESQDTFFVFLRAYDDVLSDSTSHFDTGWEKSKAEFALLNIYKAIEAIIGEPPSDDKKLKGKLRNNGIDPNTRFGINSEIPLYEFIRLINKARDKKAAHGRTPTSKILVRDLLLYQDCARFILKKALEHNIGEDLYSS